LLSLSVYISKLEGEVKPLQKGLKLTDFTPGQFSGALFFKLLSLVELIFPFGDTGALSWSGK